MTAARLLGWVRVVNYADVLAQMVGFGLRVESLDIDGKVKRCKTTDSPREKKGWYLLHHWTDRKGDQVIVGSFGIWEGNQQNAQKVQLDKSMQLSDDEKKAMRLRMQADRKASQAARIREGNTAGRRAAGVWSKLLTAPVAGTTEYLTRKGIQSHGLRYSESGALIVPMQDNNGTVKGLQFILPGDHLRKKKTGRDKEFWPKGMQMRGSYYLFGGSPAPVLLMAEGYATAATLHEATGHPVAVAFTANNLMPVAEALRKRFPSSKILICADDDYLQKCRACGERADINASAYCQHCHAAHQNHNPGVSAAQTAALAVGGVSIAPVFPADRGGKKLTDYNDLQHFPSGGIAMVLQQIDACINAQGWTTSARVTTTQQGAGDGLASLITLDEAAGRYSLVYGGNGMFFDGDERILINKQDVLDILPDHAWRDWKGRVDRKIVRVKEVGFDPSETDEAIKCNLFGGWPTEPKKGSCEKLLDLLEYLCGNEQNDRDAFEWILKWLAYPLQHPGAKMKTALVLHGAQGTGKNLFFESYMAIFGEYGSVVDQSAIEDKFNDWASKKLFLIADEVVARQELFHQKNKLKALITGDTIRINPKNLAAHEEANHMNMVFLSNEKQPLVLEGWDRRYMVLWTPEKLPKHYYSEIAAELAAGGTAALHDYLLEIELGDFNPHTEPLMTQAKKDLTDISMDSIEWFLGEWRDGDLGLPFCPVASSDLYREYQRWCKACGVKWPRDAAQFAGHIKKINGWRHGSFHIFPAANMTGERMRKRMFVPAAAELMEAGANTLMAHKRFREQEAGASQQQWFTQGVFAFNNAIYERDNQYSPNSTVAA